MRPLVILPMVLANSWVLALAQAPSTTNPCPNPTNYAWPGQALILITTISGFMYNAYREKAKHKQAMELSARQRAWDLEDRARAREDLHTRLQDNTDLTAGAAVAAHTAATIAQVAADTIDAKVEQLSRKFEDDLSSRLSTGRIAARVDRTTQETKEIVESLVPEEKESNDGRGDT